MESFKHWLHFYLAIGVQRTGKLILRFTLNKKFPNIFTFDIQHSAFNKLNEDKVMRSIKGFICVLSIVYSARKWNKIRKFKIWNPHNNLNSQMICCKQLYIFAPSTKNNPILFAMRTRIKSKFYRFNSINETNGKIEKCRNVNFVTMPDG